MMETRKATSVTCFVGKEQNEMGMTVFTDNPEVNQEILQDSIDIGMVVVPLVFQCACRHLDEFEDEGIQKIIQLMADESSK